MAEPKRQHTIIVNLEYNTLIGRHIPEPYIVKKDKSGKLGSVTARATHITCPTYIIDLPEATIADIILRCAQLSLSTLTEKYTTKKRNQNTLEKAVLQKEINGLILKYYDRLSGELFLYLLENHIYLIKDIVRKTSLDDLKIAVASIQIEPILRFVKTQTGIKYILRLADRGGDPWTPLHHDIHILTDAAAWLLIDYTILRVQHINGNKLKPFLQRDHIFVKKDMVKTYFEKFIVEVARKTEIESVGFDVEQRNVLQECVIITTYDFLADRLIMELDFVYDGATFRSNSVAKNRVLLNVTDQNEITITRISRNNAQEKSWTDHIVALGLKTHEGGRLYMEDDDPLALVQWMTENREKLRALGFLIPNPTIEEKKISLANRSITVTVQSEEDWFDIHGVVMVGDERVPFARLLSHIKASNRYYPLADGTFFLIPSTWMAKYQELAKYGLGKEDKVQIKKSQFGALDEINEIEGSINIEIAKVEDIDYTPSANLNATLRPYQIEGVKWLLNHKANGLGACLADDMGLGKTLQTIGVLTYAKENLTEQAPKANQQMTLFASAMETEIRPLRALIILPSSLVFNWHEELRKFNRTLHVLTYVGPKRKEKRSSLDKFDVVLTTYHTVLRDVEHLRVIDWEYIILDESQMIKNKDSKMFRTINDLPAKNRVSLSGTPIENSLSDLWSQMQFINPEMLGTFSFFKTHYLTPIERHGDEEALLQLAKMIKPYILRRTKEEVAKDLPELTETVQYIEMDPPQAKVYDALKSATRNYLLGLDNSDKSYKFHVFAALTKLRQIANAPIMVDPTANPTSAKYEHIYQKLIEIKKAGHKALIFSSFTKLIDLFVAGMEADSIKYATLTGKSSQAARKRAVSDFQHDAETSFFFISLKAGGTGLNLTAASYVFILDPWWNPFAEKQAIARAHRIGQENPVTVIRYISKDTIEEKILKLQEKKKSLSDNIIHFDEEKLNLDKEDFASLLE